MIRGAMLPCTIAALALLCVGCRATGGGSESPARSITGEWVLEWMHGRGPVTAPGGRARPFLKLGPDGALRGFTGVNSLSGALDAKRLEAGEFAPGPMAMTEMGAEPEAMKLESDFVGLLQRAARFRIDDHRTLVLSDASGELLRFARQP